MPYWAKTNGAEGETRTRTDISPLPPQGSVSTSFTTSAKESDDFYNSGIESSLDSISSSSEPELSFDKGKSIASLLPRSTLICGIPSLSTLATFSLAKKAMPKVIAKNTIANHVVNFVKNGALPEAKYSIR